MTQERRKGSGPNVHISGPVGQAAGGNSEGQPGLRVFGPDLQGLASEQSMVVLLSAILLELQRIRIGFSEATGIDLGEITQEEG